MAQTLKKTELDQTPLCVDLDHTLVNTDTMIELAFRLLKQKPIKALLIPVWLLRGIPYLKAMLAQHAELNPAGLPYHPEVFFYLKRMAKRGRPIYLATGANEKTARAVADYLGIFDEVFASDEDINLVGQIKAERLIQRFGHRGFDYIGDSRVDLHVWKVSRQAMTVGVRGSLKKQVDELRRTSKSFDRPQSRWLDILKCLRIHQWAKNALIFAPILLAHQQHDLQLWIPSVFAFFSFSLLASCIYVINDIWDLDADRQHHDKKERPFASGRLPLSFAAILIPACLLGSMLMAASLPLVFWKVLGSYLIITSLYTFHLKSIAIADVMILAGLYSIRLLAGGVVAGIQLSPWLLAFSGFFFVSLAMVKRTSELLSLHKMGKDKPLGRGYRVADIPTLSGLGTASGYGAVLIMALYINSGVAGSNYQRDELLWLFCPILMYWISRVWLLTNRGEIDSDPVKFAIKDRFSWGCVLTVFVIWAIASGYVH